jgi:hypothetical protein
VIPGVTDVDVKHVGGDVTQHVGDITNTATGAVNVEHNSVGGDINTGVSAVHDVVSDVNTDLGHNVLGNLHVGDVGSNNDFHLGH